MIQCVCRELSAIGLPSLQGYFGGGGASSGGALSNCTGLCGSFIACLLDGHAAAGAFSPCPAHSKLIEPSTERAVKSNPPLPWLLPSLGLRVTSVSPALAEPPWRRPRALRGRITEPRRGG